MSCTYDIVYTYDIVGGKNPDVVRHGPAGVRQHRSWPTMSYVTSVSLYNVVGQTYNVRRTVGRLARIQMSDGSPSPPGPAPAQILGHWPWRQWLPFSWRDCQKSHLKKWLGLFSLPSLRAWGANKLSLQGHRHGMHFCYRPGFLRFIVPAIFCFL